MGDPYKRDRRLGRWSLSGREMMKYPGRIEEIQPHVTILRAVPGFIRDEIEFMGRCPDFEVVEDGDEIPVYRPVIDGEAFHWERV